MRKFYVWLSIFLSLTLSSASCALGGADDRRPVTAAAVAPTPTTVKSETPMDLTFFATTTTPPTTKAPKPRVIKDSASRGGKRSTPPAVTTAPSPGVVGQHLGRFYMTCYQLTGTTASGHKAGPGSIAVDPRIIRLETPLHVVGWGDGYAWDTGGKIKGYRIDVWQRSCYRFPNGFVEVYRR